MCTVRFSILKMSVIFTLIYRFKYYYPKLYQPSPFFDRHLQNDSKMYVEQQKGNLEQANLD